MAVLLRLAWQALRNRLHWRFAVTVARRVSPIEDRADPLANATGSFRFRYPNLRQEVADHRAGYFIAPDVADMRDGIIAKGLLPLLFLLLILPLFAVLRQIIGGVFATGRGALLLPDRET